MRPHFTTFNDLEDHKAIFETRLTKFTCLHVGTTIPISVGETTFKIDIVKIFPENQYNAICIINKDV